MQMMARAATDLAPAPMIAGAIPLIDVAGHLAGDAESSRKAAAQLRWAFENVGFYYICPERNKLQGRGHCEHGEAIPTSEIGDIGIATAPDGASR